jgi:prophage antirepressor-like protein
MEGTSLQVFSFGQAQVRVHLDVSGNPWWVARDVCNVLEIDDAGQAVERLDGDEAISIRVIDSMGRTQTARAVNESGLYSLVLGSRKPAAKAFKRWLTHEVIPQLRRTGSYTMPRSSDAEPVTFSELAQLVGCGALEPEEARAHLLGMGFVGSPAEEAYHLAQLGHERHARTAVERLERLVQRAAGLRLNLLAYRVLLAHAAACAPDGSSPLSVSSLAQAINTTPHRVAQAELELAGHGLLSREVVSNRRALTLH